MMLDDGTRCVLCVEEEHRKFVSNDDVCTAAGIALVFYRCRACVRRDGMI
jgi:hypothetical protein